MHDKKRRIAVIGLDCAQPGLIQKHIAEGGLPTFKKLKEQGFWADDCMCPLPTVTPPSWATIATGAWPGTHGITDFHYQKEGSNPDNSGIAQCWSSERLLAETIWDAADRNGLKSIVLTYPGSSPSRMKHGMVVGGKGMTVGEARRHDLPGLEKLFDMSVDFLVSNRAGPYCVKTAFDDAGPWAHAPDLGREPLEAAFDLPFLNTIARPAPHTWHLLAHGDSGEGYTRLTLATGRDFDSALCTLAVGEWSGKITTPIAMLDGPARNVFFKCKLLRLSDDAEEFRLLIGAMVSADDAVWGEPPQAASCLWDIDEAIHHSAGLLPFVFKQVDMDTWIEMNAHTSSWHAQAAVRLMRANPDWDVFYMHSHPIDWQYHAIITDMISPDAGTRERAWDAHRRIYEIEDKLLALITAELTDNDVLAVVSDHGATPDGPVFDPFRALIPAGLCVLNAAEAQDADAPELVLKYRKAVAAGDIDWARTKAVPQREIFICVNLKGRDPNGIVTPEEYPAVQQAIIDALLAYRDPVTGTRPVALALTREDARWIGLYGERCGDVVYAINPWFGAQHGPILPSARWEPGALNVLFLLKGPGIRKGVEFARPCHLVSLVPTLCQAAGFPMPADVEGAVLYPAFENHAGPMPAETTEARS